MAKQKNWIVELADAIQDEYGVDTSKESARPGLVNLISKHCPFKPDALYMKVVPQAPGHVYDWAAKCGAYLHAEGRPSSHRIAAVVAHFAEPLVKLLQEAKRSHYHEQSPPEYTMPMCCPQCSCRSWPDDPEADFEPSPNMDLPCTCGADAWNAKIDAVLGGTEEP